MDQTFFECLFNNKNRLTNSYNEDFMEPFIKSQLPCYRNYFYLNATY